MSIHFYLKVFRIANKIFQNSWLRVYTLMQYFGMDTTKTKVQQNYKVDADIAELLEAASTRSGVPKTKIVEDAIAFYAGKLTEDQAVRRDFVLSFIAPTDVKTPTKRNPKGGGVK